MEFLDESKIKYGKIIDVNAKEKINVLNKNCKEMYDLGYKQNFILYRKGSVIPDSSSKKNEHMCSFKYGYRIETVDFFKKEKLELLKLIL